MILLLMAVSRYDSSLSLVTGRKTKYSPAANRGTALGGAGSIAQCTTARHSTMTEIPAIRGILKRRKGRREGEGEGENMDVEFQLSLAAPLRAVDILLTKSASQLICAQSSSNSAYGKTIRETDDKRYRR